MLLAFARADLGKSARKATRRAWSRPGMARANALRCTSIWTTTSSTAFRTISPKVAWGWTGICTGVAAA